MVHVACKAHLSTCNLEYHDIIGRLGDDFVRVVALGKPPRSIGPEYSMTSLGRNSKVLLY